jgi:hypothetical protein
VDRVFSPKRLQKEGKIQEVFDYYKKRYYQCLDEKDSFLSSLYLDEVAQTLMISHVKLSFEQLHEALVKVAMREDLDQEAREQASLDIQVTLRKRYPEKFKATESEEDNQAN